MTIICKTPKSVLLEVVQTNSELKSRYKKLKGRKDPTGTHNFVVGYAFNFFDLNKHPSELNIKVSNYIPNSILNAISHLLSELNVDSTSIRNILLLSLAGNKEIPKHIDNSLYLNNIRRFHYPVISDNCVFNSSFKDYKLTCGNWYELQNNLPHAVYNHSENARVHLLVDIYEKGKNE